MYWDEGRDYERCMEIYKKEISSLDERKIRMQVGIENQFERMYEKCNIALGNR